MWCSNGTHVIFYCLTVLYEMVFHILTSYQGFVLKVYYKYKHISTKKKNKYRYHLQKFEYLWGIARYGETLCLYRTLLFAQDN